MSILNLPTPSVGVATYAMFKEGGKNLMAENKGSKSNDFKGFAIDSDGYFVARLEIMKGVRSKSCHIYKSPSPRDQRGTRIPS